MAFCTNCGTKLDEKARFCLQCGTKVEDAPDTSQAAPATQSMHQTFAPMAASDRQTEAKKNGWTYFTGALKKFAVVKGRARRAEFWWFTLFYSIFYLICIGIDYLLDFYIEGWGVFTLLYSVIFLLPGYCVMIRRLHDCDKQGWLFLIPIYNIVIFCTAGTTGKNRFGSDPKQTDIL
ncbi:MAG: DUF805 domain-containing protein [Spirochaetaceae bacterium]|jgi:uncharacterized membrane protein YhaH (DUF805 family)|nr:DUF805 domain-containing protein [Spirochaetaceae bacterium]